MTDTPKIEPALTPEAWGEFKNGREVVLGDPTDRFSPRVSFYKGKIGIYDDWSNGNDTADLAAIIALANAALPDDDPRKITRAHTALLFRIAQWIANGFPEDDAQSFAAGGELHDLGRILASYLPPQEAGPRRGTRSSYLPPEAP